MSDHSTYRFAKIVDLSHPLSAGMPGWPTQPTLSYEYIKEAARDGHALTLIRRMVMHTGTHIDAPAHFIPGGPTVDQLPLDSYYGEGIVIDLTKKKSAEEITREDLNKYDKEIRPGRVIILRTGWDKKLGWTHDFLFRWPHLNLESANYLASRKVKAVGIDGLSIGGWAESVPEQGPLAKSSPSEVHKILLSHNVLIIEMLSNLDSLLMGQEVARAFFIFAPLNFVKAEGSPCRALALVE